MRAQLAVTAANLQQHVGLGCGFFYRVLNGDRNSLAEACKLQLLLVSNDEVLELISQAEHPQQFDLAHRRLKVLIVLAQSVVGDVVLCCNAAQVCCLECSSLAIIPDQVVRIKLQGSGVR